MILSGLYLLLAYQMFQVINRGSEFIKDQIVLLDQLEKHGDASLSHRIETSRLMEVGASYIKQFTEKLKSFHWVKL